MRISACFETGYGQCHFLPSAAHANTGCVAGCGQSQMPTRRQPVLRSLQGVQRPAGARAAQRPGVLCTAAAFHPLADARSHYADAWAAALPISFSVSAYRTKGFRRGRQSRVMLRRRLRRSRQAAPAHRMAGGGGRRPAICGGCQVPVAQRCLSSRHHGRHPVSRAPSRVQRLGSAHLPGGSGSRRGSRHSSPAHRNLGFSSQGSSSSSSRRRSRSRDSGSSSSAAPGSSSSSSAAQDSSSSSSSSGLHPLPYGPPACRRCGTPSHWTTRAYRRCSGSCTEAGERYVAGLGGSCPPCPPPPCGLRRC